jgi:hypothetical protein
LRLEITPPPDGEPVAVWAHERCLAALRHGAVEPDDPQDHGRIPPKARCVFCGEPLPFIGRHPFVFDVGAFTPPHRFWAHADCMIDHVVPTLGNLS